MAVKCVFFIFYFFLGRVHQRRIFKMQWKHTHKSSKSKANNVCSQIRLSETAASWHCTSSFVTSKTSAHTENHVHPHPGFLVVMSPCHKMTWQVQETQISLHSERSSKTLTGPHENMYVITLKKHVEVYRWGGTLSLITELLQFSCD